MNFLKEKRPKSITYTRNEDGTYQVVYTGITGVGNDNVVFVDADVQFPKCKIDWNDHGALPTLCVNEILEDDDDNGTLLNVVVPDCQNTSREGELKHVREVLHKFGIDIKDKNGYRPVNEVMIDIAELLKFDLETGDAAGFCIRKDYILQTLVGHRYKNIFG